jgi:hypothetical protein
MRRFKLLLLITFIGFYGLSNCQNIPISGIYSTKSDYENHKLTDSLYNDGTSNYITLGKNRIIFVKNKVKNEYPANDIYAVKMDNIDLIRFNRGYYCQVLEESPNYYIISNLDYPP